MAPVGGWMRPWPYHRRRCPSSGGSGDGMIPLTRFGRSTPWAVSWTWTR